MPSRLLTVAALFLVAAAVSAADADPIKAKLDAAKGAYDAELEKYQAAVGAWFDKREETARGKGDKDVLDQIKGERKAFDDGGDLPKAAPATLRQKPAAARAALGVAYGTAVKEYTKAKQDAEAEAVEGELKAFRLTAGTAPQPDLFQPGSVWKGTERSFKPIAQVHAAELIVTERTGDTYKAKYLVGKVSRDVEGKVARGAFTWAAVPGSPNPGSPHTGTVVGKRIAMKYSDVRGGVAVEGAGTLDLVPAEKK